MIDLIVRYRWTSMWVAWVVYCWLVFHLAGVR
jgi:hypothetical protein